VALVGFFSAAPMFLLGLVGGMLADRMPRQRLLSITQGMNVTSSVILTLLLGTGTVQVWHAYMTILLSGACWALDTPSRRAVIYDLLGVEGVTNAVALDSVGQNASRMCGPALAGVLITLVGVTGGYVAITLFCTIAWMLLSLVGLWAFSMSHWYVVSLPILLLLGLGTAGFGAMQSTLVMLAAPEEMRGRALGVLSLAIGTGPVGSLFMGAMASAVHPVFAIRMNALLGIVALACIMVLLPAFTERTQPVRVAPLPPQAIK